MLTIKRTLAVNKRMLHPPINCRGMTDESYHHPRPTDFPDRRDFDFSDAKIVELHCGHLFDPDGLDRNFWA
jgi:hypothetical protein